MESSRRDSVKAAGVGIVSTALGAGAAAAQSDPERRGVRWGFLMDAHRCKDCLACVVACKTEFEVPLAAFRCAVKEWNLADASLKRTFEGHTDTVNGIAVSPEPIAELREHSGDLEVVCFSPDDALLATGCRGGDVKLWSVPEFKEVKTLRAPFTR